MLNRVILHGRLVADPEIRKTSSGVSVANIRIAVDRNYKSKDNNAQNTDFITLVAWRTTADFVGRYFSKGDIILVEGSLQVREYVNKDGKKQYATEVVIDNAYFPGMKKSDNQTASNNTNKEPVAYQPPTAEPIDDDAVELPF